MSLETLFLGALDADAEAYAHGVFSTLYRRRGGAAMECYVRANVVRVTLGDTLRYVFRDEAGARDAARQIREALLLGPPDI
jgi:hypothetical protein